MRPVMLLSLAIILSCSLVNAAPLTIVEEGEGRAAIVIASGEEHARQAAEGIQKYTEKMSGARLDIIEEGQSVPAAKIHIYVGHTAAAKEKGIKIPSGFDPSIRPDAFDEEGYVLKTRGNNIFIGGNSDGPYRGTFVVPKEFKDKPIHFWCGGAMQEAWFWVNGQYAGHHQDRRGRWTPYGFNLDVSALIRPGETHSIAIRVWNQTDLGGLYQRGFFWSPKNDAALEGLLLQ